MPSHQPTLSTNALCGLFVCIGVGLVTMLVVNAPSHQERSLILGANQHATAIGLHADREVVTLLGAKTPVQVTLTAPDGKVFQATERKEYTFTSSPGQRHDWLFALLDPTTNAKSGDITFRMKTTAAEKTGLKSNEQAVRSGKYNKHTHSYYFFQARDTQSSMPVNLGEYRNPGSTYLHTSGKTPTFEVVLKAPPGESFAWPAEGTSFSMRQEGQATPKDAVLNQEYRVKATNAMQTFTYWFNSGNGTLYSRAVGTQYVNTVPSLP